MIYHSDFYEGEPAPENPKRASLGFWVAAGLLAVPFSLWRILVSPLYRRLNVCKFNPSCSSYGLEAVLTHGVFVGGLLTLNRLFRCSPFTREDGLDVLPVSDRVWDSFAAVPDVVKRNHGIWKERDLRRK